jgi:hypothetical protein
VAIAGTLEPEGATLHAPLSGSECLVYDWSISHWSTGDLERVIGTTRNTGTGRTEQVDKNGFGLAPSVIRSEGRAIRLLALPGLEGFPDTPAKRMTAERARSYIGATHFEELPLARRLSEVARITADDTGAIRADWKLTDKEGLENAMFQERFLPPGAAVCVVGRYSAAKNAIVPEANVGGVRAIRGSREEALAFVGSSYLGAIVAGALLILLPAAVIWGVLTYREHWFEANHRPSVKSERQEAFQAAVAKGDVTAIPGFVRRGADPDVPDSSGYTPLIKAPDAGTAEALLAAGAHVNAPGRDGFTPLMAAAAWGHADVVKLLLEHHADPTLRDTKSRRTALEWAAANEREDLVQLLRAATPADAK